MLSGLGSHQTQLLSVFDLEPKAIEGWLAKHGGTTLFPVLVCCVENPLVVAWSSSLAQNIKQPFQCPAIIRHRANQHCGCAQW